LVSWKTCCASCRSGYFANCGSPMMVVWRCVWARTDAVGGKGGVGVVIVWQVDELEVAAMMLRLGKRGRWSCGRASRTICSSIHFTCTHKTHYNLALLPQSHESLSRALLELQRHSASCGTLGTAWPTGNAAAPRRDRAHGPDHRRDSAKDRVPARESQPPIVRLPAGNSWSESRKRPGQHSRRLHHEACTM
jgi:hypothetical protein